MITPGIIPCKMQEISGAGPAITENITSMKNENNNITLTYNKAA